MPSEAQASSITATAVIDAEALLAPIADDNPAGENLQYTGLHDEIREARRADEDFEQGDWKRDLKVADWRQVVSLATEALASRTKDLQVGAWLVEALVKLYGFVGLRDGLNMMRELHERFWDSLYPENDEGDLDARANALAWMDRQTAIAIKDVQITEAAGGANFSYNRYEESAQFDIPEDLSGLESEQREPIEALKIRVAEEHKLTTEDWAKAKRATRRADVEFLYGLLNECWAGYEALDREIDEKFGRQTPGLGDLRKALDAIRSLISNVVKEKRLAEPYPDEAAEPAVNESAEGHGDGVPVAALTSGSIRARQDAFKRLAEVADYFRANEPHSPVAYLVQRAIKWGQMPLEMWLEDVIKDGGVLGSLRETLGLQSTLSESSD